MVPVYLPLVCHVQLTSIDCTLDGREPSLEELSPGFQQEEVVCIPEVPMRRSGVVEFAFSQTKRLQAQVDSFFFVFVLSFRN